MTDARPAIRVPGSGPCDISIYRLPGGFARQLPVLYRYTGTIVQSPADDDSWVDCPKSSA